MNKFLGVLGLVASVAGTVAPLATGFNPKIGAIVAAAGFTAQAVTKPVTDISATWRKLLGKAKE